MDSILSGRWLFCLSLIIEGDMLNKSTSKVVCSFLSYFSHLFRLFEADVLFHEGVEQTDGKDGLIL